MRKGQLIRINKKAPNFIGFLAKVNEVKKWGVVAEIVPETKEEQEMLLERSVTVDGVAYMRLATGEFDLENS